MRGSMLSLTRLAVVMIRWSRRVTPSIYYGCFDAAHWRSMKFTWFNLMPWPYLPDDFREKNRSVWVDIDQRLFDPVKSHEVYNTYMDLLEYAGTLGFDGIGVNEHHQNGYGIMPSPEHHRRRAWRAAPRTSALVVLGNSIALYNPPVRVAEEFAMLDCISGGRLVAGFPVGTSMDTNYCYGQIPALTREKYAEAHELIIKAWHDARAVRLQRPLQQAAPRQHLAAADPAAASADPHSRRRLGRDLRLLHRQHLFVFLPELHRLHPRQGADGRLLGARRGAQRAGQVSPIAPASRRPSASPTPTRRPSGSTGRTSTISTIAACTSIRASPTRPATAPSRPSRRARCRNTRRRAAASPS